VVRQLKSLPFGAGLRVIHSTEELPPLPVVALGTATASDQAAVQKALPGLCSGEQGASLCHLFRTETFVPATEETFAAIVRELR
jgi:ABC-type phosphate/phosphonate transport system substrate-binding protein